MSFVPREFRQPSRIVVMPQTCLAGVPLNEITCVVWDGHFWGEDERFPPVHHFAICFLWTLRAEWGITWTQTDTSCKCTECV